MPRILDAAGAAESFSLTETVQKSILHASGPYRGAVIGALKNPLPHDIHAA
jgi:hypothetical protein